jgi:hypothetical protein
MAPAQNVMQSGCWDHLASLMCKSFLLLFFKKEESSFSEEKEAKRLYT